MEADPDGLSPRRLPKWRIVHAPRVAIRETPQTTGQLIGSKMQGDVVESEREESGWIRLNGAPGWMLIDGAAVGLGPLLECIPVPSTPLSLCFSRPDDGKALLNLETTMNSTVREVKAAVAAATGLQAGAMVLARGKMGQRISDSAANLFADHETLWACGYIDGQEVGYMYLGDAAEDLARGPS